MWSFGAPAFLAAAALAAAVVTALHLLAWRRPKPSLLPTARFIPAAAVRAVSRDLRLTDATLLALRVLALLLLGLALAAPRLAPAPRGEARLIVADRARGVADVDEVHDSVEALGLRAGETRVIWFDSLPAAAVEVGPGAAAPGAAAPGARREVRGALAPALVAAVREGERMLHRRERVEVVVISPLVREEVDLAVAAVREAWRGALTVVQVAPREEVAAVPVSPLPSRFPPTDDPLGAAYRLALGPSPRPALHAERAGSAVVDTAFAREGGIVVRWPSEVGSGAPVAVPRAVTTGEHTLVGALAATPLEGSGRTIAWWEDGSPAALEEALGAGCVRTIGWRVPEEGDVVLRPAFLELLRSLSRPCGDRDWTPIAGADVAALERGGGDGAPTTAGVPPSAAAPSVPAREPSSASRPERQRAGRDAGPDEWARWFLLVALGVLGVEGVLRQRRASREGGSEWTAAVPPTRNAA